MTDPSEVIIEVRGVTKRFDQEGTTVQVLNGIDLDIRNREMICIQGRSGAGKSTLLHILGTLDLPTTGSVSYHGKDVTRFNSRELAAFRNATIGFVFQFHHLLPEFDALENVMMPGLVQGRPRPPLRKRAQELLLHLFGAWGTRQAGSVSLLGADHAPLGPADSIAAGVLMVSEDRRRFGLVMDESIRFNLTLSSLAAVIERGLINRRAEQRLTRQMATRLHIKAAGLEQPVRTLSGGNQQKVVLGKALLCRPKVVLLDEPTRGVDVGAKQEIYGLLDELRREGLGVLMVSSDLPELLGMSDRVLVLGDGTLKASLRAEQATPEALLHAALELRSPAGGVTREAR